MGSARPISFGLVVAAGLGVSADVMGQGTGRIPALRVTLHDHSPNGATELGTAQARATDIYRNAGVALIWVEPKLAATESRTDDLVRVVILGGNEATRFIGGSPDRLGFAVPGARRVYIHYDRVHSLARHHKVPPGWFLGVVLAHELVHVLLPEKGHAQRGVMSAVLNPDPAEAPVFTQQESESIRARLRDRSALAGYLEPGRQLQQALSRDADFAGGP